MHLFLILLALTAPLAAGRQSPGTPKEKVSAPVLGRIFPLEGVRGPVDRTGISGRIDHMTYDPATKRLFIACVANGSLEVIDLDSGRRASGRSPDFAARRESPSPASRFMSRPAGTASPVRRTVRRQPEDQWPLGTMPTMSGSPATAGYG